MRSIAKLTALFWLLALVLAGFGMYAMSALALIVWVAVLAAMTMKQTAATRKADFGEELSLDSRALYSPIRRTVDEIEEIVKRDQDSAVMKVVGGETLEECQRIRDQVAKGLKVRDELRRAASGRHEAQKEIARLTQAGSGADPALDTALAARREEIQHYDEVDAILAKIEASVTNAKASLDEMKARLSMKASAERAALTDTESDVRETLSHMKALSLSFDEGEHLLESGS